MKFIEQKRTHIPAETGFIQRKFMDLAYAPGGDRRTLDIYLPNEGEGPYPVIIDIFGGGWYFGQKSSHKLETGIKSVEKGICGGKHQLFLELPGKVPNSNPGSKSCDPICP